MLIKLIFGLLITIAAILALLLVLIVVGGVLAGLLAPFIGAVPVSYNFRSIRERWTSTIVAVLGIAGTVGVFVAMLSLARGFKATLVASGSPTNALVMRAGSSSEMMGGITLDSVRVVQDAPGVARGADGPLVTQEVVGVAPFPLVSTGTDANVQVRGVSPNVLTIRPFAKIVEGRMLRPGLSEMVVGKNASKSYAGLTVGNTLKFGGGQWKVVGVFDAGGSSFDSEVWCDAHILAQVLKRPDNIFQSATVHLTSPDAFPAFKDALLADPRLNVDVWREIDYYAKQSTNMTRLITVLGGFVAAIMAIGAIFGALNTMYSAVSERGREIATMRALGFTSWNVILSFLFEALLISFVAGLLGCLAVLPLNGLTTNAMNFQTFSNLAFAFKITFDLLLMGILFALVMGVLGGLLPAIRASIRPVAVALREL
ncbi:MAG TPA: ABC transporter permease [Candidatus Acidoferrum sp.]|nr:ABC transporter permease [Candidatus Acidoferrum sp.]